MIVPDSTEREAIVEENKAGIEEKITKYRSDVEQLIRYLPWLESKSGRNITEVYLPDEGKKIGFQVPVDDSTLLSFMKRAQSTQLIDKNYVYVYSRKRIRTPEDELRLIDHTQIMEMENIGAVLSKYVLKGRTKASLWNEGITNGVFYHAVKKMKELIEFWSVPM